MSGRKFIKNTIPHIIALGLIGVLVWTMFSAMMSTNNNGEFGYSEQGIYLWKDILPYLIPWFLIGFVFLEMPVILYQYVKRKAESKRVG